MLERLGIYWTFIRPFTLTAPALGMLSGGLTAAGADEPTPLTESVLLRIGLGTLMAAVLNAASNALNQVYDLDNDRINKPHRMIPMGKISTSEALRLSTLAYLLALALAALVGIQCFALALIAAVLTIIYSVPPLRTKRSAIGANLTIAIPRGLLLKVAGWSTVKSIFLAEAWTVGAIFGLFLLGATTTKDFADVEGDRAAGCHTFPVRYGLAASARLVAPFFVVPFALIPVGVALGLLTGNPVALTALGSALALWGIYVARLVLRDPDALAETENHPSWVHMYAMMLVAQVGFAAAYFI